MEIKVYKESADLAAHAADFIIESAQRAISERGRFVAALAGGRTPKDTYTLLAKPDRAKQVDWSKIYVFFGDERFVGIDSPDSNFGMAQQALLSQVDIPKDHIFPMPSGPEANEQEAARAYAQTIADFFEISPQGLPPRFDLILLGLGDDGHTASLFPGADTLSVTDAWVAATPPGTLPPPVDRLTFTYPLLNAARQVAFLVSGAPKAAIIKDIVEGHRSREVHPALGVQPVHGEVIWMLDESAASGLKSSETN